MNNHEQIDYTIEGVPEFIPPENEEIKIEGVKEWYVEKENQENHNGI